MRSEWVPAPRSLAVAPVSNLHPGNLNRLTNSARGTLESLHACSLSTVAKMARQSLLILICGMTVSGCQQASNPAEAPMAATVHESVVVTSQPLLEMAQTIVRPQFELIRIVPHGTSSLDWNPTAQDVRALQKARVILINGAGYEPWRDRVSLPASRLKDTASGYYDQFIRIPDAVKHQHGPDGLHSHPGTVWATWLDPNLAMAQLSQVTASLVRLAPDEKATIELESAKLRAQFEGLNSLVDELAAVPGIAECAIVSDGPYYQYLTNRLGCRLTYLHWPLSGDLSEKDLQELTTTLSDLPAVPSRIFLHGNRNLGGAKEQLIAAGFRIVSIDLCEQSDEQSKPFVERMRMNLDRLKAALTAQ